MESRGARGHGPTLESRRPLHDFARPASVQQQAAAGRGFESNPKRRPLRAAPEKPGSARKAPWITASHCSGSGVPSVGVRPAHAFPHTALNVDVREAADPQRNSWSQGYGSGVTFGSQSVAGPKPHTGPHFWPSHLMLAFCGERFNQERKRRRRILLSETRRPAGQ